MTSPVYMHFKFFNGTLNFWGGLAIGDMHGLKLRFQTRGLKR